MRTITKLCLSLPLAVCLSCSGGEGSSSETSSPAPGDSSASESAESKEPEAAKPTIPVPQTYSVRGKVADPWNDPVPGSAVRIVASGAAEDAEAVAELVADDQGEYETELPGAGPWTIHARHPEVGVQSVDVAAIELGEVRKAPMLRLSGEGRFVGRLLDAERNPLADEPVVALSRTLLRQEIFQGHESFDMDNLPLYAPVLDSGHYVRGQGFHHVQAVTLADGSFEIEGLAPDDYLFFSKPIGPEPWLDTNRHWYTTSQTDLDLVSGLCNLEISIADDGVLPPDTDASQRRRLGPIVLWPTVPSSHGSVAFLPRPQQKHAGEVNVFWLPPGEYVVRAVTYPPTGQWGLTLHAEDKIVIEEGDAFRKFLLKFAPQDRPKGRLRVSVKVPEGFDAPETFHLLTVETGESIECSEYSPFPEPRYNEWLDIPEGEYLVALKPFEDYTGRSEVVEMANIYRRIVVKAGEDTEYTLESTFGGFFRLELDADRFVLGGDVVQPEGIDDVEWERLLRFYSETAGASISVQRDDGGPALELRLRDRSAKMGERRKRMLPGEVIENFVPLEPGEYNLWVLLDGFERSSSKLTIKPRETTTIQVRLASE